MYLARFEVSGDEWIQAAATIDVAARSPASGAAVQWDLIGSQLSAAARIPGSTIARRITLDRFRTLRQTIALTAAAEHEQDVRAIVARLTRLERMGGGALALPHAAEERDAWMERLGRFRLCATSDGFSVSGVPLACNFRIADALDDLFTDASVAGHELSYQLHVRAAEVSPESVRLARKSMLALRDLAGVREALIDWQEDLARMLGHAAALCEEYLVVDSTAAARAVEQFLGDRFRAQYGPLGFPSPAFRFEPDGYQDTLVNGVHSHDLEPVSPVALCSLAEPRDARDRLLAWKPSARVQQVIAIPAPSGNGPIAAEGSTSLGSAAGALPEAHAGPGPVAFVSYKRDDLAHVVPVVRLLQELGVPVWYDRGIPGGTEWDEVIENQLTRARLMLVCASQAAIESKYVRREVKFADALDVPILPVLLEDVAFGHGMRMLLTQYQMLDIRTADFAGRLRSAVTHVWPR